MNLKFCCECGEKLIQREIGDEGIACYCEKCTRYYFDNPKCCVLICILNSQNQVLLLKQNYICANKWTLCSGYIQHGETLEQAVSREVSEETGQVVLKSNYVKSYYFKDKGIIMAGFVAYVEPSAFGKSKEVDDLKWFNIDGVDQFIARDNNFSEEHLRACLEFTKARKG